MKEIKYTIQDPKITDETLECPCGNPVSKHSNFRCNKCKTQMLFFLKGHGNNYGEPKIYNKIGTPIFNKIVK